MPIDPKTGERTGQEKVKVTLPLPKRPNKIPALPPPPKGYESDKCNCKRADDD